MAPVQCVGWGHPDTTGSPAIDYFLSSELLETADADEHYTERLVRLPAMGVYYHRPERPIHCRNRMDFGFAEDAHLYACPQTLYKFHPDFDAVIAGILQSDPRAEIVLLEGRVASWTNNLRRRFARTLPDSDRVRFIPSLSYEDFLSLLTISDVILDPLHFGGGNSSYEALAMETPVVTLPSLYLRGRITMALYKKMAFTELVVSSPQQYIESAVRLATDPDWNYFVRNQIREKNSILFEDLAEIRGLEQFLLSLT
jgi:protein O-GlcNAc transferase